MVVIDLETVPAHALQPARPPPAITGRRHTRARATAGYPAQVVGGNDLERGLTRGSTRCSSTNFSTADLQRGGHDPRRDRGRGSRGVTRETVAEVTATRVELNSVGWIPRRKRQGALSATVAWLRMATEPPRFSDPSQLVIRQLGLLLP